MIINLANDGLKTHLLEVVRQLRAFKEEAESDGITVKPEVALQVTVQAVGSINAIQRTQGPASDQVSVTVVEPRTERTLRTQDGLNTGVEESDRTEEGTRKGSQVGTQDERRTTEGNESQTSRSTDHQTSGQTSTQESRNDTTSTDKATTRVEQANGGQDTVTTEYDR